MKLSINRPPAIGDLLKDNHGRLGIVVRLENPPNADWMRDQLDTRLHTLPTNETWLGVVPLSGGLVIVPASLAFVIRTATEDDLRDALAAANLAATKLLADACPDAAQRLLRMSSLD